MNEDFQYGVTVASIGYATNTFPRYIQRSRHTVPYHYSDLISYNGRGLLKSFQESFPLLTIITNGGCGETAYDCLQNNQVYRIQTFTTQRRVLMRETRNGKQRPSNPFITCPLDTTYTFCVLESEDTCGYPASLASIIKTRSFPVQVKFAPEHTELNIDGKTEETKYISKLSIIGDYEENFFAGKCIHEGMLDPVVTYAALSPIIKYAVIRGIKGSSPDAFQQHLNSLDKAIEDNKIVYDRLHGNPYITRVSDTGTGTGNPLSFLKPEWIHDVNVPPLPPRPKPKNLSDTNEYSYAIFPDSTHLEERDFPRIPENAGKDFIENPLSNWTCSDQEKAADVVDPFKKSEDPSPTPTTSLVHNVQDKHPDDKALPEKSFRLHLEQCSIYDVSTYLRELQLEKYVDDFAEKMIDGSILCELDEDILREEFHFTRIETIRLKKFIKTGHIPRLRSLQILPSN